MKKTMLKSDLYTFIFVSVYFLLSTIFFFYVVLPDLNAGIVIGADSKTYILTARYYESLGKIDLASLFSLKFNFFGPVVLLVITRYDYFLIYMFNFFVFATSCLVMFKYFKFNRIAFFALIFLNPISLLSFTTINKEIFGMCSIILLLSYIKSGRKELLLLSFTLAFLTRWQQAIFIPVLLFYLNSIKLGKNLRWQAPILVLLIASFVYPFISKYINFTGDVSRDGVQQQFDQIGGILPFLNSLQDSFLYFIAFVPKSLINYFGNFTRVGDVFNKDIDFYNRMLVGHQLIMLFMILWLFLNRKVRVRSIEFQIVFIYSVIYCVALTINYRYFYPLYPLFVLLAISNGFNIKSINNLPTLRNEKSLNTRFYSLKANQDN